MPAEIQVVGKNLPAPNPISGRSVPADGRVAVPLETPDSWFWRPGFLNRRITRLENQNHAGGGSMRLLAMQASVS
ncbi:MAG: hypothetical protein DMF51_02990 [Acidobacteria bacterium]|nr:MAG: hypothetical protein DMF51_02990 [Acidobacteriota bacterium]